ncbi:hypothetical protein, partial [Pseudomonas sp. PB103]|uniref:hypothetical protein n=1 Tax=Pseudomonas sp. PB103 TaxID=2494698 RepID=UPI001C49BF65
AAGCDLLILFFLKSTSKDRSLRQLLQGIGELRAKKSPISLMRSIGLQHSGATSAKGGSMRVEP